MHYLLYKTTNLLNGDFYVGVHQTQNLNDGYLGSGKLLKQAIKKYGVDNFQRDILAIFETPEEMFEAEHKMVNAEFIAQTNTYNLRVGGEGGWGYINSSGLSDRTGSKFSEESRAKISASKRGKHLSKEHRAKLVKNNAMRNRPEIAAKVSKSLTGRSLSAEHRANISAAITAAHRERKRV